MRRSSTTYVTTEPTTATTGDGWTVTADSDVAPDVGDPLRLDVVVGAGQTWTLAFTRVAADTLEGTLTALTDGATSATIDLSCVRS